MKPTIQRNAKAFLIAALIVFALLVIDILVAKVQVMMGINIPLHLGDTGQFLLLLVAVVLFVIGALFKEKVAGSDGNLDH
ncbi:hypothetical protein MnTg02_03068 [bacterium MnTg02]|nr:hypothetical protein MnTg02_03068 [bacterium MnTg02]